MFPGTVESSGLRKLLASVTPRRHSIRNLQNPNFARPSTEMVIDDSAVDSDSASEYESSDETSDSGDDQVKPGKDKRYMTPKFRAINQRAPKVVVEVPTTSRSAEVVRAKNHSSAVARPLHGIITPAASSPLPASSSRPTEADLLTREGSSSKRRTPPKDGSSSKPSGGMAHRPSKRSKTAPTSSVPVLEIPESPVNIVTSARNDHARTPSTENGSPMVSGSTKRHKAVEDRLRAPKEIPTSSKKRKKSISIKASEECATGKTPSVANLRGAKSEPTRTCKRPETSKNAAMNSAAPRDSSSKPESNPVSSKPRPVKPQSSPEPMATRRPPHFTDLPECSNISGSTTAHKPTRTTTCPSRSKPETTSVATDEPGEDEVHIKVEDEAGETRIYPPNSSEWKGKFLSLPLADDYYRQSKLEAGMKRLERDGIECHDDATFYQLELKAKERAKDAAILADEKLKRLEAERQQAQLQKRLAELEKKQVEDENRKLERKFRRAEKERKRLEVKYKEKEIDLEQTTKELETTKAARACTAEQSADATTQESDHPIKELRKESRYQIADGHGISQECRRPARPTRSTVYVVNSTSVYLVAWVIAGVQIAFPSNNFNLYRHTLDEEGSSKMLPNWAVEFSPQPSQVILTRNGITLPNTPGRNGKDWWCFTYKEDAVCSFCKGKVHETLIGCPNLLFETRSNHARPDNQESSKDGSVSVPPSISYGTKGQSSANLMKLTLPQEHQQRFSSDGGNLEANTAQPPASEDLPTRSVTQASYMHMHASKCGTGGFNDAADTNTARSSEPTTSPAAVEPKSNSAREAPSSRQLLRVEQPSKLSAPASQRPGPARKSDLATMMQEERSGQKSSQPQYRRREVQPLRTLPEESGLLSTELQNPRGRQRPSNLIRREVAVTDSLPACVCRLLHDYFANGLVARPCLETFKGNEVEFWENIKQIVSCRGHDKEMITYCQGLWDGEQARRNAIASTAFEKSPPPAQLPPTRQPSQPPAYGAHVSDQFIQRGPRWGAVYGPGRRETIPAAMFYGPSASRTRPSCVGPEPAATSSVPQYRQRSFREFEGFLSASQSSGGASSSRKQRMIELD